MTMIDTVWKIRVPDHRQLIYFDNLDLEIKFRYSLIAMEYR